MYVYKYSFIDVEAIVLVFGIFSISSAFVFYIHFHSAFLSFPDFHPFWSRHVCQIHMYNIISTYIHTCINNRTLNYAHPFASSVRRMHTYIHIYIRVCMYISFYTVACKLTNVKLDHVFPLKHIPPFLPDHHFKSVKHEFNVKTYSHMTPSSVVNLIILQYLSLRKPAHRAVVRRRH